MNTQILDWIVARFPRHLAVVLWQQYLDARGAISGIGTAARDFPARKELLL